MLKTLALRGFRGFESYELTDLATVNLIVGKNNCGKTTVLEAVYLLASDGDPDAFYDIAERRDELNHRIPSASVPSPLRYEVVLSPLFYGYECRPGAQFVLSSENCSRKISAQVLSLEDVEGSELRDLRTAPAYVLDAEDPAFCLRLASCETKEDPVYLVDRHGAVLHELWHRSIRRVAPRSPSVRFLGLESVAFKVLEDAWAEIVADGRDDEVARDMRLLVPEIDTIHFQPGGSLRRDGAILVGRSGGGRRMPLSSYGDGLRRLLALRLSLVGTRFLLIDEIDAGFHWTAMADVWRLLVEVARNLDVQIFATTHSYDCIRGLGSLVKSHPDLAGDVSIQKVHPSLEQAVSFAGDQIAIAVDQQIELR